jgi:hypothetical protein
VTFDGAHHVLYFDGVVEDTATWDAGLDFQDAVDLLLGGGPDDDAGHQQTYFVGSLDEFAVYDHALSAERIAYHYAVGAGVVPLPPAGDP